VHRHIEWLTAAVYEMGYRATLHDIATRHAEIDATWEPIGRRSYEDQVARRIAEMRGSGRCLRDEMDRRAAQLPAIDWPTVAIHGAGR
jgi:hypothetical protein